jgi:peptide-methionine (S)-S-oxide reductase
MAAMLFKSPVMPTKEEALPGRSQRFALPAAHFVNENPLEGPFPDGFETAMFGLGCFWGAERKFWQSGLVYTTLVGYAGGYTPNPTYEETCTGRTGHNEVVVVVFDPSVVSYDALLKIFWESHDPTQGMRQGNDVGTTYRSGIYVFNDAQRRAAQASLIAFQPMLDAAGYGPITTEIVDAAPLDDRTAIASPDLAVFFPAETYHQQYLAKNPGGYCGLGGTGVSCPIGVAKA